MGDALNVKVNVSVDKSANLTCSQLSLGPSTKAKHALSQGEETGNPTFLPHLFGLGFFMCKVPLSLQKLTTQDWFLERQHSGVTWVFMFSHYSFWFSG